MNNDASNEQQPSLHAQRLQEIENRQHLDAADTPDEHVFSQPLVEALTPHDNDTPPVSQLDVIERRPLFVNWTAVICTAIVAAAAAVVLCVAKPWLPRSAGQPVAVADTASQSEQEIAPATRDSSNVKPLSPKELDEIVKNDTVTVRPQAKSTLPLLPVTTTGTANRLNSVRLVDISKRKITEEEVRQLTKDELYVARNAYYARRGYQFNNAELREFYGAQTWFRASDVTIDDLTQKMSETEKYNIDLIKARETALNGQ